MIQLKNAMVSCKLILPNLIDYEVDNDLDYGRDENNDLDDMRIIIEAYDDEKDDEERMEEEEKKEDENVENYSTPIRSRSRTGRKRKRSVY